MQKGIILEILGQNFFGDPVSQGFFGCFTAPLVTSSVSTYLVFLFSLIFPICSNKHFSSVSLQITKNIFENCEQN